MVAQFASGGIVGQQRLNLQFTTLLQQFLMRFLKTLLRISWIITVIGTGQVLTTYSPSNIILRIASVYPPSQERGADQFCWADSKTGSFTVKSAYHAISKNIFSMDDCRWNLAWSWKGPQSIRIFIWLVLHDRVKTKSELSRRHFSCDTCDRCGCGREDLLHAIRDYMVVRKVWNYFLLGHSGRYFYSLNKTDWMKYNLGSDWSF